MQVLAEADRELRLNLGGALAQDPAFGLPRGAVGQHGRELALALGRYSRVVLGELQALALEGQRGRIGGPTAQEAGGRPLEFNNARSCFVRAALRLAARAACVAKLVGEVFGVLADALVELREFGPQLVD